MEKRAATIALGKQDGGEAWCRESMRVWALWTGPTLSRYRNKVSTEADECGGERELSRLADQRRWTPCSGSRCGWRLTVDKGSSLWMKLVVVEGLLLAEVVDRVSLLWTKARYGWRLVEASRSCSRFCSVRYVRSELGLEHSVRTNLAHLDIAISKIDDNKNSDVALEEAYD